MKRFQRPCRARNPEGFDRAMFAAFAERSWPEAFLAWLRGRP